MNTSNEFQIFHFLRRILHFSANFYEFFSGFRAKFQKRVTSVDFQSNLRKQIRKLPKFLKFVKIIQFYSMLFNRVLNPGTMFRLAYVSTSSSSRVSCFFCHWRPGGTTCVGSGPSPPGLSSNSRTSSGGPLSSLKLRSLLL